MMGVLESCCANGNGTESKSNDEKEKQELKQRKKEKDNDPNNAIHTKARQSPYANTPNETIDRFKLADNEVRWKNECKGYEPTVYTHSFVLNHKLPDKSEKIMKEKNIKYKFNEIDDRVDRTSFLGQYALDSDYYNLPKNPIGRTGLCGRGHLWRWGPNHAADPIVTRWKRDEKNHQILRDQKTNKQILEFVAIERSDGGGWAIPGGMVDPGEHVSRTLKREFGEETMDTIGITSIEEKKKVTKLLDDFFTNNGTEIFKGYCDDPRNTDNAWMETVAVNYHDKNGDVVAKWKLKAGDDASKVKWMEISRDLKLYASHNAYIQKVVQLHDAHW